MRDCGGQTEGTCHGQLYRHIDQRFRSRRNGFGFPRSRSSRWRRISLREAILLSNASGTADTITFDASLIGGTVTLTAGELSITNDLTIDGDLNGDDAADITLSGNDPSRVLKFATAATGSTLSSLNITGGKVFYGAGVYVKSGATVSIDNSTLDGNESTLFGGAATVRGGGVLNISNSTISNNTSDMSGAAGILSQSSTLNLLNTTVVGNSAPSNGGAMRLDNSTVSIVNSTISGNTARYGAGVYSNGSTVDLVNSIVLGNNMTGYYAGINPELRGSGITETASITSGDPATVFATTATVGTATAGVLADNSGTVDAGAVEVAAAASLIVTTTLDTVDAFDGETSLREAIGQVNAGTLSGTITFANGVGEAFENGGEIDLTGGQLSLNSAVTIDGDLDNDGIADVTVDAQGNSRIFQVSTTGAVIDGLVVTGGSVSNSGGGIYLLNGSSLTLAKSSVENNTAAFGRGIESRSSDLIITNSRISGNSTNTGSGGGICQSGTLLIEDSTISDNTAATDGGGIRSSGILTVVNSTISGNISNGKGGGIFATNTNGFSVTNSTVHGNTAAEGTGICLNSQPNADFTNTTISGNHATSQVGGLYVGNKAGYAAFSNVVFIGNTGSDGVSTELGGQTAPTFVGFNLVGESASQFDASVSANVANANAASVFAAKVTQNGADARVLADNGGPVETVALLADVANPAFETGDSSLLDEATAGRDVNGDGDQLDTIATDANVNARVSGGAVDLGAVELQQEADSLIVTTAADVVDAFDGVTSLREAIAFANSDADASTITFAAGVGEAFENGGLIRLTAGQLNLTQETIIDGAGNVTITGDANDNDVTVEGDITDVAASGNSLLTDNTRIFNIGSGAPTDLNGLTLTGGRTNSNYLTGGGIRTTSELTLNDSTLIGNSTRGDYARGGGISSYSSVTLNDSIISNNSTAGYQSIGGGVSAAGGVTLIDTTVSGNSTSGDGA